MSGFLGLVAENVTSLLSQPAPLIIGSLVLQGFEVPSHITIGGSQAVTVHKLPGGGRIIDAMGPDDGAVAWHGLFIGPDAAQRARNLDVMRIQGTPQLLSFGDYSFNVIIVHCEYDYQERGSIINYRIRTEIVPSLSSFIAMSPDIRVALQDDLDAGQTLIMGAAAVAATYGSLAGKSDASSITASAYGLTTVATGIGLATAAIAAATPSTLTSDGNVQLGLESVTTALQSNISTLPMPLTASISLASITTASSLALATAQAGSLAALVQTSGYINRARANLISAST